MSEIEELQLFSAVIFPASEPVVIIKQTPTYDTGTGPLMKFDKIHSKEATVTWPNMHSFRYFDNFEIVKLSKPRAKITHLILFR